jgi:ATP-binding protein involved in chromosome partitioning
VAPAVGVHGVRVMSTDLLLDDGAPLAWREPEHERHVWRGTLAAGMLREFLSDVAWGKLDLLLVDLPPDADRLAALGELVPNLAGVLVVTIPSAASLRAVERAVAAAGEGGIAVLGIVENMARLACATCGAATPLFSGDAAVRLAAACGAPLLASIPFDPAAQSAADAGRLPAGGDGAVAAAFGALAAALEARLEAP